MSAGLNSTIALCSADKILILPVGNQFRLELDDCALFFFAKRNGSNFFISGPEAVESLEAISRLVFSRTTHQTLILARRQVLNF